MLRVIDAARLRHRVANGGSCFRLQFLGRADRVAHIGDELPGHVILSHSWKMRSRTGGHKYSMTNANPSQAT